MSGYPATSAFHPPSRRPRFGMRPTLLHFPPLRLRKFARNTIQPAEIRVMTRKIPVEGNGALVPPRDGAPVPSRDRTVVPPPATAPWFRCTPASGGSFTALPRFCRKNMPERTKNSGKTGHRRNFSCTTVAQCVLRASRNLRAAGSTPAEAGGRRDARANPASPQALEKRGRKVEEPPQPRHERWRHEKPPP